MLSYTWSYKGTAHEGKLELRADGAEFSDSWHREKPALATVQYTYDG